MPTETVYGLAANACSEPAVEKIYKIKGRPSNNPLIIHVDTLDMALKYGDFNDTALKFARAFWNMSTDSINIRPLTLVVPLCNASIASRVTAGLTTIGIRLPAHPMARQLIHEFGLPLAAPSANKSNYISPTCADNVRDDLMGLIPIVLDGGGCEFGLESTIVDVTTDVPKILRFGSVTQWELSQLEPSTISSVSSSHILAPGMMKKHYSPRKPLRINVDVPLDHEVFLAFGNNERAVMNLSEAGSVDEAAVNLYRMLRILDSNPLFDTFSGIAVSPIPMHGVGEALNDRLQRAAFKETSR